MPDKVFKPVVRQLPVIFNNDHAHVMARAELFHSADSVMVQITASGKDVQALVQFLELDAPIAISLIAVPIENMRDKREKTT